MILSGNEIWEDLKDEVLKRTRPQIEANVHLDIRRLIWWRVEWRLEHVQEQTWDQAYEDLCRDQPVGGQP